jgi:dimethylargininase
VSLVAITRGVAASIGACELTHLERQAIDVDRARAQHRAYETALERLGCSVERLPALDSLPDSVFVEDVAVVLDEIAIVTRPGAESRRPEAAEIAPALAGYQTLAFIEPPGTLDGGDVLRLGRRLYVGLSARSNECGIGQLREIVGAHAYTVTGVPILGCLHLKSAVTEAAPGVILVNPGWIDPAALAAERVIEVDPDEPGAANGLAVAGRLIYPMSFPRTRRKLEDAGLDVVPVDVSELQKAEGAVTCCSLILGSDLKTRHRGDDPTSRRDPGA